MKLSIIIVNWNSAAYCAECLASVYASGIQVPFEIIVIDNASYDGCDKMLERDYPSVVFIQGKTNAGFAAANNTAFTHAKGEVLCFLNPDTVILKTALQTLYDNLLGNPGAGAVGAMLYNKDGSPQTTCVLSFPTLVNQVLDVEWLRQRFPRAAVFGSRAVFSKQLAPQAVEALSGACIMLNRQIFSAVGGFSEDYFMYAEDIDLCLKIRLMGHSIQFINEAEIIHFGGGSSRDPEKRLFGAVLLRESTYKLLRKFRGAAYATLYRASLAGIGVFRVVLLLLCLPPAIILGRGPSILAALSRWLRLSGWAAGFLPLPMPSTPRTFLAPHLSAVPGGEIA